MSVSVNVNVNDDTLRKAASTQATANRSSLLFREQSRATEKRGRSERAQDRIGRRLDPETGSELVEDSLSRSSELKSLNSSSQSAGEQQPSGRRKRKKSQLAGMWMVDVKGKKEIRSLDGFASVPLADESRSVLDPSNFFTLDPMYHGAKGTSGTFTLRRVLYLESRSLDVPRSYCYPAGRDSALYYSVAERYEFSSYWIQEVTCEWYNEFSFYTVSDGRVGGQRWNMTQIWKWNLIAPIKGFQGRDFQEHCVLVKGDSSVQQVSVPQKLKTSPTVSTISTSVTHINPIFEGNRYLVSNFIIYFTFEGELLFPIPDPFTPPSPLEPHDISNGFADYLMGWSIRNGYSFTNYLDADRQAQGEIWLYWNGIEGSMDGEYYPYTYSTTSNYQQVPTPGTASPFTLNKPSLFLVKSGEYSDYSQQPGETTNAWAARVFPSSNEYPSYAGDVPTLMPNYNVDVTLYDPNLSAAAQNNIFDTIKAAKSNPGRKGIFYPSWYPGRWTGVYSSNPAYNGLYVGPGETGRVEPISFSVPPEEVGDNTGQYNVRLILAWDWDLPDYCAQGLASIGFNTSLLQ